MPKTLTLKNMPDELYERIKLAARVHGRSIGSEVIVCLAAVLQLPKVAPYQRLARARSLRAALTNATFRARDIDRLKHEGQLERAVDDSHSRRG